MVDRERKRPRTGRAAAWLLFLLVVGAFSTAWWVWTSLHQESPRFHFLLIEKNDQQIKLLNGEVLQLHPRDRIRILKISSSLPLGLGFRLYSSDFDVNALFHEKLSVLTLLPDRDPFDRYLFRIFVKYDNRDAAQVDIQVEPYLEDWLDKARRTIDPERRIAILKKASTYLPAERRIREMLLETYKSSENWSRVAMLLEEIAEEKPSREVLRELLDVYTAMSGKEGIISTLKRILEQDPEDIESRLRLASALEEEGRLKEALEAYEEVLKRLGGKERLPVYKTLGFLYTRTGEDERAISAYLKALELDKEDVNVFYNLSALYEKRGEKDRADLFLAKALGLQSGDLEGRLQLAERLIKSGDVDEAEKYLLEVLRKDPGSREALLLEIRIAEARKDKPALIDGYRKILAIDPKNETVIYNLGILEYEAGHLKECLPYLERFSALRPGDKEVHAILFDVYQQLRKDDLAFRQARELVRLRPEDPGPYQYMFEYLNNRSDYKAMTRIMTKGLESHPGSIDLKEYLVLAYLKTGKEDLAIRRMKEIIGARPDDTSLLLRLARLQEKRGDREDALENYERILARVPDDKEAKEAWMGLLESWALDLEREEGFEQACGLYRKVLDVFPDNGNAREGCVRVLLRQARDLESEGKLGKALDSYKKVLDLSPGQEEAEEAYLRLRLKVLPGETHEP